MRKKISAVVLSAGLLMAGAISATAQTPQPGTPRPAPPAAAPQAEIITVTGCLMNEKDVPGLKPNVAERAGITEDYILTNVKIGADSKVAGIGLGSMYEIEGVKEGDLKQHLGHQIEVTGRLSRVETGSAAANASNRGDVPDFYATTFKMLAATCPAQ